MLAVGEYGRSSMELAEVGELLSEGTSLLATVEVVVAEL